MESGTARCSVPTACRPCGGRTVWWYSIGAGWWKRAATWTCWPRTAFTRGCTRGSFGATEERRPPYLSELQRVLVPFVTQQLPPVPPAGLVGVVRVDE